MAPRPPLPRVLILLAGSAGVLDAIAFLQLKAFAANQTGNSIFTALALGRGQPSDLYQPLSAIVGFVGGAFCGGLLVPKPADDGPPAPSRIGTSLLVETALLAAFAAALPHARGTAAKFALLALASSAMGVQSAVTARLGRGVSTTYMSGTLERVGGLAAEALRSGDLAPSLRNLGAWLAFFVPAIVVGRLHAVPLDVLVWLVVAAAAASAFVAAREAREGERRSAE